MFSAPPFAQLMLCLSTLSRVGSPGPGCVPRASFPAGLRLRVVAIKKNRFHRPAEIQHADVTHTKTTTAVEHKPRAGRRTPKSTTQNRRIHAYVHVRETERRSCPVCVRRRAAARQQLVRAPAAAAARNYIPAHGRGGPTPREAPSPQIWRRPHVFWGASQPHPPPSRPSMPSSRPRLRGGEGGEERQSVG